MTIKSLLVTPWLEVLRAALEGIENSPVGYRIVHGALWSLVGAIFARGASLAAMVVAARILGVSSFGQLGVIQSTVIVFQVFAGFGLGVTAAKYVSQYKLINPAKAGKILALSNVAAAASGIVMTATMWVSAPWLAEHTLACPELVIPLRISSLIPLLEALRGAQAGAMVGFEAFKSQAFMNLGTGIAAFPMIASGAYLAGVTGAVWGLVLVSVVGWLIGQYVVRGEAGAGGVLGDLGGCWQERRVLLDFALPALLAGVMVAPVNWACTALLANQPNGYVEMGMFNAANQWFAALLFLPAALSQPVLPILSERLGTGDHMISARVLKVSMILNGCIVTPFAVVGSVLSPWIMNLYGPGFSPSWPVLVVVLLTAAIFAIQHPVGHIISASGRMWLGFIMNLGWGLVFVTSTWCFLSKGALGLAGARGIAYFVHGLWTLGFAWFVLSRRNDRVKL